MWSNKFLSRFLIHVFQDYSEWKRGFSDLSLPTVHINRMDHLTSYVQEVTDAVEELCDLIHKSYEKKVNLTKKGCEYMQHSVILSNYRYVNIRVNIKVLVKYLYSITLLLCPQNNKYRYVFLSTELMFISDHYKSTMLCIV